MLQWFTPAAVTLLQWFTPPTGHVVAQKRTVCVPPCIKSRQHPKHFPTSPLGQYYAGSLLLDFGGRKTSGVFRRIWPSATGGKLLKLTGQAICIGATHVSYGVRTHAHLHAVDLKPTPLPLGQTDCCLQVAIRCIQEDMAVGNCGETVEVHRPGYLHWGHSCQLWGSNPRALACSGS